jgi:hypothetical protein
LAQRIVPLPPCPPTTKPALITVNEIEQVSACAVDAKPMPASRTVAESVARSADERDMGDSLQ